MKKQNKILLTEDIVKKIVKILGKKIFGILQYGSSVSARRKPNDLDLIVVLTNRETLEDIALIHSIVSGYKEEVDIQIINSEDIYPESFSHDTHGQFFIPFIKSAKVLYGKNPFSDLYVSFDALVTSVMQKCQYYYFRAKKQLSNKVDVADIQQLDYHKKKILLMLSDIRLVITGSTLWYESIHHLEQLIIFITKQKPSRDEIEFLLGIDKNVGLDFIFSIYRKYYFAIIDLIHFKAEKKSFNIKNASIDLVNQGSKYLCLILPGCPSDYNEKITSYLGIIGIDSAVVHYSGTGKSNCCDFNNPANDVLEVVNDLKTKYEKIFILANSYGGYVALSLENDVVTEVSKIICISPAIALNEVKGIETLANYITSERSYWYRFSEYAFDQYLKASNRQIINQKEKYIIFHGEKDEQINSNDVEEYAHSQQIRFVEFSDESHMSINKFLLHKLRFLWQEISILGMGYDIDKKLE